MVSSPPIRPPSPSTPPIPYTGAPEANHAGCYLITSDVDEWHRRLLAADLKVTPIEDMPWGMHEFTLTDPSGNKIRIGCNTSTD